MPDTGSGLCYGLCCGHCHHGYTVHLRQKNPDNNVFLSDGTGYMTSHEPYLKHLHVAEAWVEVSPNTPCLYYLTFFLATPSLQTKTLVIAIMLMMIMLQEGALMHQTSAHWLVVRMGSFVWLPQWTSKRESSKHQKTFPSKHPEFDHPSTDKKNIDYAVCQVLNGPTMVGVIRVLLIYDIMCQWWKTSWPRWIAPSS
jgi:hypothetical protein